MISLHSMILLGHLQDMNSGNNLEADRQCIYGIAATSESQDGCGPSEITSLPLGLLPSYLKNIPNHYLIIDQQRDAAAIIDNLDMHDGLSTSNGPSNTSIPIRLYLNPQMFQGIGGNMSVKQEPKANNRIRYGSDGRRFLPDSRYHPISINVSFQD